MVSPVKVLKCFMNLQKLNLMQTRPLNFHFWWPIKKFLVVTWQLWKKAWTWNPGKVLGLLYSNYFELRFIRWKNFNEDCVAPFSLMMIKFDLSIHCIYQNTTNNFQPWFPAIWSHLLITWNFSEVEPLSICELSGVSGTQFSETTLRPHRAAHVYFLSWNGRPRA